MNGTHTRPDGRRTRPQNAVQPVDRLFTLAEVEDVMTRLDEIKDEAVARLTAQLNAAVAERDALRQFVDNLRSRGLAPVAA